MKLDWNLIRTVLAHVEAETIEDFVHDARSFECWKEGQLLSERNTTTPPEVRVVYGHIQLLSQAGYIEGIYVKESVDGYYTITLAPYPKLTLDGYNLLESLRQQGFLDKLKKYATENSIPLTISSIKVLTNLFLARLEK